VFNSAGQRFSQVADTPRTLGGDYQPVALPDGDIIFIYQFNGANDPTKWITRFRAATSTWEDVTTPDTPCPYTADTSPPMNDRTYFTCIPVSALPDGKVLVTLNSLTVVDRNTPSERTTREAGKAYTFDPNGPSGQQWKQVGPLNYRDGDGYKPEGILIAGDSCGSYCNMVLAANRTGSKAKLAELYKP